MPLVDSPRLTAADRARWAQLEHYDDVLARDERLDRMADRARQTIAAFAAAGGCYAGVSWGKDSVIVAYLIATAEGEAGRVPLVHVRPQLWANPDCARVRDVFLARYPHVRYDEIVIPDEQARVVRAASTYSPLGLRAITLDPGFEIAVDRYGPRHISGVRAAESGTRSMTMRRNREASARSCRPIGWWTTEQVFAGLARWGLPVHPVYAMSQGGARSRDHLRVSAALGGEHGDGFGRAELEERYYRAELEAAYAAEAAAPPV